jgi:WhiB family redox-sensing transcriptional regulator
VINTNWRAAAACRGYDPKLFDPLDKAETYAIGTKAELHPRIQAALAVCRHCPVQLECDLASGQEEGVWAGSYRSKTKAERQAAARKKAAA